MRIIKLANVLESLILELKADTSKFDRDIEQSISDAKKKLSNLESKVSIGGSRSGSKKEAQVGLKAVVDDSQLTKLNEHLESKRTHAKDIQRDFNRNPITPKVDTSQLDSALAKIDRLKRASSGTITVKQQQSKTKDKSENKQNELIKSVNKLPDNISSQVEEKLGDTIRDAGKEGVVSRVADAGLQGISNKFFDKSLDGVLSGVGKSISKLTSKYIGDFELAGEKFTDAIIQGIPKQLESLNAELEQRLPQPIYDALQEVIKEIQEGLTEDLTELQNRVSSVIGEENLLKARESQKQTRETESRKQRDLAKEGVTQSRRESVRDFNLAVRERDDIQEQINQTEREIEKLQDRSRLIKTQLEDIEFGELPLAIEEIQSVLSDAQIDTTGLDQSQIVEQYKEFLEQQELLFANLEPEKLEKQESLQKQLDRANKAVNQRKQEARKIKEEQEKLLRKELPELYEQAIVDIAGALPDESQIPQLVIDDKKLDAKGAEALYGRAANTVTINSKIAQGLESGELSEDQFRVLYHELRHALQNDFGTSQGAEAARKNQAVFSLQQSPEDLRDVAPYINQYDPSVQGLEADAEITGRQLGRGAFQRQEQQKLQQRSQQQFGLGGVEYQQQIKKQLNQATQQVKSLFQSIKDIDSPDIANQLKNAIDLIGNQSEKTNTILESITAFQAGELDAEQFKSVLQFTEKQMKDVVVLNKYLNNLQQEVKQQLEQSKSENLQEFQIPFNPQQLEKQETTSQPKQKTQQVNQRNIQSDITTIPLADNQSSQQTSQQSSSVDLSDTERIIQEARQNINNVKSKIKVAYDSFQNAVDEGNVELANSYLQSINTVADNAKESIDNEIKKIKQHDIEINPTNELGRELYGAKSSITKTQKGVQQGIFKAERNLEKELNKTKKDIEKYGKDINAGLASGLQGSSQISKRAIEEVANELKEGFGRVLEIRSPSRVFARFGQFINRGLGRGLGQSEPIKKFREKIKQQLAEIKNSKIFKDVERTFHDFSRRVENTVEMGTVDSGGAFSEEETDQINDALRDAETQADKMDQGFSRLLERARKDFESSNEVLSSMIDNIFGMGDASKKAEKSASGFGQTIKDIFVVGAGLIGFGVIENALEEFIKASGQAAIEAEKIETKLSFSTGKEGAKVLENIKDEANDLALSYRSLREGYSDFVTALQGTELEAQADDIFSGFAAGLSVRGSSAEQQESTMLALTQMASKGKISMQELNQQLANALPGALNLASEAMGVTNEELFQMVERGEVLAEDLLPRMASALERQAESGLTSESLTAQGNINRLENNILSLQETVGEKFIDTEAIGLLAQSVGTVADNIWILEAALLTVATKATQMVLPAFIRLSTSAIAGIKAMTGSLLTMRNMLAGVKASAAGLAKAFVVPAVIVGGITAITKTLTAGSKQLSRFNAQSELMVNNLQRIGETAQDLESDIDKSTSALQRLLQGVNALQSLPGGEVLFGNLFYTTQERELESGETTVDVRWRWDNKELERNTESIRNELKRATEIEEETELQIHANSEQVRKELQKIDEEMQSYRIDLFQAQESGSTEEVERIREELSKLRQEEQSLLESDFGNIDILRQQLENLESIRENFLPQLKDYLDASDYAELEKRLDNQIERFEELDSLARDATSRLDLRFKELSDSVEKLNNNLANTERLINNTITQQKTADIFDNIFGTLSDTQLDLRGQLFDLEGEITQTKTLQTELNNVQRHLAQFDNVQFNNLLKLKEFGGTGEGGADEFYKQLLGSSPEVIANVISKYEEDLSGGAKTILEASQQFLSSKDNLIQSQNNVANGLKSLYDSIDNLQDEIKGLQDEIKDLAKGFFDSIDQLNGLERDIKDFNREQDRAIRDLAESYEDYQRELERDILETKASIEDAEDELKKVRRDNQLFQELGFGAGNLAQEGYQLFNDLFNILDAQEDKQTTKALERLDLEEQTLEVARQTRDLQEQKEDLEREQLRQQQDLKKRREEYINEIIKQWNEIVKKHQSIQEMVKETGLMFAKISNGVAEQGNNLTGSIYNLAKAIQSQIRNFETTSSTISGANRGGVAGTALAEKIRELESGGNYGAINRGRAGDTQSLGQVNQRYQGKSVDQLTVGHVMDLQRDTELHAVGAYQIIPETLKELVRDSDVTREDRFDESTQDKLFEQIFKTKRRELGRFISGESDNLEKATRELALEFSSFPALGSRLSAYHDRAGISPQEVQELLKSSRENFNTAGGEETPIQPVEGPVTSPYGMRKHPITGEWRMHRGTDYGAPSGTPIEAPLSGTVKNVGFQADGAGHLIDLEHANGVVTRFFHLLEQSNLEVGQQIQQGETIGKVGSTGRSNGPHLHFEVVNQGEHINPEDWLRDAEPVTNQLSQNPQQPLRELQKPQQLPQITPPEDLTRPSSRVEPISPLHREAQSAIDNARQLEIKDIRDSDLFGSLNVLDFEPLQQNLKQLREQEQKVQKELEREQQQLELNELIQRAVQFTKQLTDQARQYSRETRGVGESVTDLIRGYRQIVPFSDQLAESAEEVTHSYRDQRESIEDILRNRKEELRGLEGSIERGKDALAVAKERGLSQEKINELEKTISEQKQLYNEAEAETIRLKEQIERLNNTELDSQRAVTEELKKQNRLEKRKTLVGSEADLLSALSERKDSVGRIFEGAELQREAETLRETLNFREQLEDLQQMQIELGLSDYEAKQLRKSLTLIHEINLENIKQETDILGNNLREVAEVGLSGVIEGFNEWIQGTKSLGEVLQNTVLNVLNRILDTAQEIAIQGIMGGIFPNNELATSQPQYTQTVTGGSSGLLGGLIQFGSSALTGGLGGGLAGSPSATSFTEASSFGFGQSGMFTPSNFANGGTVGIVEGFSRAMKKERMMGGEPVPLVASRGEEILSKKNGDAQFYRSLNAQGLWDDMKNGGIDNYAYGGSVGKMNYNSTNNKTRNSDNRPMTVNAPVTVVAPKPEEYRRSQNQIEREQQYQASRAYKRFS